MEQQNTNPDMSVAKNMLLASNPEFRKNATDIIGSVFSSVGAGKFNRTLDNPEVMKKLQNQRELERVQDTDTLLLTGIVSAISGLFGGAVAGESGAAAGLSGAFQGAASGVELAGKISDNRKKEEEVDALRRKALGITDQEELLGLGRFAQNYVNNEDQNIRSLMSNEIRRDTEDFKQLAKKSDAGTRIVEFVEGDKAVQAARSKLDAISVAREQLKSNNPNFKGAFQTLLAKGVSGDVGTLSDKDIERYNGNRALLARAEQAITEWVSGKWSEENVRLFEAGLAEVERLWKAKMQDRRDELNKQFQATRGSLVDKKTIEIASGASASKRPTLQQIQAQIKKRAEAKARGAK